MLKEELNKLSIACFLFDSNTGGPTIRARSVYKRMISDGHKVVVVFPRGKRGAMDYIAAAGVETTMLSMEKPVLPSKPFAFVKFATSLPVGIYRVIKFLKKRQPDVMHVNGAYDIVPAIAGKLARVPVVWHLNDTLFAAGLARIMGYFVMLVATKIVVSASRVGEHYGIPQDRAHIIHVPVDLSRFRQRDPNYFPTDKPNLGFIGNWNWIKGQDLFVEVIHRLRKSGVPVRATMMGKFLDSQKFYWEPIVDRIKADGLDGVIERMGFVEDIPAELAKLDLLLVTSHSEAGPMCVVEAMALGVPQVVFDVGSVREMGGEEMGSRANIVVPKGDVDAMAQAVINLLDDPQTYYKCARCGRLRAEEHYSLEKCVEKHEQVYRAAIKS